MARAISKISADWWDYTTLDEDLLKDAAALEEKDIRQLATRVVTLHPMTLIQNARTSGGGQVFLVPTQALSVGPQETWKAEKVSIWHPGHHDNAFGMRLTTMMISKRIPDAAVPMSLMADHPDVQFNFYRRGLGSCQTEMH